MITITTDKSKICDGAWSFPIEELGYLLEEHDNQTFVLVDDELWETDNSDYIEVNL